MFDPKKPVQTRDGRKARIICDDRQLTTAGATIIGLVMNSNNEDARFYHSDGREWGHRFPSSNDLINIPEKHTLRGWVNVYSDNSAQLSTFHNTREHADRQRVRGNCLACIEITREFEEGEGL